MATRRQKVYNALKNVGFLPFEARDITRVSRITPSGKRIKVRPIPLSVPYVKEMIRERAKEHRAAKAAGVTDTEWIKRIRDRYDENDWYNREGNRSLWPMIREYEDRYRAKHPQYESPGEKRKRKTTRDFIDRWDRGEQKYPKGAAYR
jgi:hypothetical protein